MINEPVGAPEAALKVAVAPMAPEPLLPLLSAPLNATTVIEAAALCAIFAVTLTLLKAAGANARQISASPGTLFARATNCHVNPAPLTDFTVFGVVGFESAEINASSKSLELVVEKYCVLTELVWEDLFPEAVPSMTRELPEVCDTAELSNPTMDQNAVIRSTQTCIRLMLGATLNFR